ncbi:OmpA family protein [Pseudomonas syringae group genomosp. 3]|uniref:OmpA/MotB domain-containing protein n=1 Tax=Pseudomonas syringae pv. viburni TaxID=251703 RepID=A0A0Q0DFB7_9PSED|nr:OmpA family protein [Pseudomonas syringae group genomosp. 3]KPZ26419.1 OmpA/MotB domain-containing protein [Pseudomonas syringae pv. viburni]
MNAVITLDLTRSLWLWAAALALALLMVIPLAGWISAVAALVVVIAVIVAWIRAGYRFARQGQQLVLADPATLPAATYRQPVVLVCGDGLADLFGKVPAEQLALRTTSLGCYVRVPALDQLSTISNGLQALRPHWRGQLSVMLVTNPGEHTDAAELAGRVRAFCHQIAVVRERGIGLPLMLVSYVQAAKDKARSEHAWFSWEDAQPHPLVREAGACTRLTDWQRQTADSATCAARLCRSVQVSSAATWLKATLLPHFEAREANHPRVCAINLVPVLPQALAGNLWQQWLCERAGLSTAGQPVGEGSAGLPFPDPLLNLLPLNTSRSPILRASVTAWWLFMVAGVVALASSAWQNNLLLRQVTDDLRRYASIPMAERRDQPPFALREDALTVLRQDAMRLDNYYRQGEPLALGLGLYRGERLRLPLLATIASHRQLPEPPTLAKTPDPVRLDSLSLFSTGSAELKAGSTKVLINALVNIKAQPGWLIVIAGHTDVTGSPEHNLELSRARAASVRDWMQRMGDISDSCFAVQGFGANQPVASNDTEAGRAANRRVDIRLVPEVGACLLPTAALDRNPLSHPAAFNF